MLPSCDAIFIYDIDEIKSEKTSNARVWWILKSRKNKYNTYGIKNDYIIYFRF